MPPLGPRVQTRDSRRQQGLAVQARERKLAKLPVAGLTPEQAHNARIILDVGQKKHAPLKQRKAAIETGMVESNLRNLDYGDSDSLGVFQQRPSAGWGTPDQIEDPSYAASRFYDAAKEQDRPGVPSGTLAQLVQRSAYPLRYGQRSRAAQSILRALDSY